MVKIFKEFLMSHSATDQPLKTFFEPKTLSELGITGHILLPAVRYEHTTLPKTGLAKWLSHLPKISKAPIAMDIDVGCVLMSQTGKILQSVHYGNIRTDDGSVRHGGDGLLGASDFEEKFINQEQIQLHLNKIDQEVHHLFIIIANHHKQPLPKANKGLGVLRDNEGALVHEFELASLDDGVQALVAWHLQRDDGDWRVSAPLKSIKHADMTDLIDNAEELLSAKNTRW